MELSKYIKFETSTLNRSQIRLSDYNPRGCTDEGKKHLKRGIKKFGSVEAVVVNKRTGYTLVGGHQRISVLDELNKYPANDYALPACIIDVDEKGEKELNILLNNPNAQGYWDYDKLAQIVPDIDWKDAGLTDADLNMIGVDYLLQTEEEASIADELAQIDIPLAGEREQKKEERRIEREAAKQSEQDFEERKAHMMQVKKDVREEAAENARDLNAYVMLSFDTYEAKAAFMRRFGYDENQKFIKGEVFENQVERIE